MTVDLTDVTGSAPWNADDTAGHDSSGSNDTVRTNDLITYKVSVSATEETLTGTVITLTFPQGQQMFATNTTVPPQFSSLQSPPSIPPFCLAGSTLTPSTVADPPNPMTMTSYQSLPTQTLTCLVADIAPGTAMSYSFVTMVRPEMPNGYEMSPVTATVDADTVEPLTSEPVQQTVSATSKWNIGINGAVTAANTAFIKQGTVQRCANPALAGQMCFVGGYPITISVPDAGKGGVPVVGGAFDFQINVDPATSWGTAATGASNTLYGGYISNVNGSTCDTPNYQVPWPKSGMNDSATTQNSVRNSGSVTCTQPGGPGTPILVHATGVDSSAFTIPTYNLAPAGSTTNPNYGYVFSQRVWLEWPVAGISTFGTDGVARVNATVSNLSETDIDGSPNLPGSDAAFDNYRRAAASYRNFMTASNFWAGVPDAPTATTPIVHAPGYPAWWGPSGPTGLNTGDGVAVTGQRVLNTIYLDGDAQATGGGVTTLSCVNFDNSLVAVSDFTVADGGGGAPQQAQGNTGTNATSAPAWISGSMVNYTEIGGPPDYSQRFGDFQVQYSNLPSGAENTNCSGSDGWYDSPADVPGSDPTLAAQGTYTGVTRVRVLGAEQAGRERGLPAHHGLDRYAGALRLPRHADPDLARLHLHLRAAIAGDDVRHVVAVADVHL